MNLTEMSYRLLALLVFVLAPMVGHTQDITVPRPSPKAVVSQTIGLSEVSIVYSSPAVKGRKIWGNLVPYDGGKPNPWRAGANENTTFMTTHDLTIQGKRLPAGMYGIHMIPSEHDWTIIFSRNHTSWGSFFYTEEEDALRIVAKPQEAPHCEWLRYGFEDLDDFGAKAYLHWEKVRVSFRVEVAEGHETVLANFRNELRGLAGFFSAGYVTAARYCIEQKINYEEALKWTDRAIANGGGFQARIARADLLTLSGKSADGTSAREAAIESSTENELNNYGYTVLNEGNTDEAVRVFALNVKRFPDSWNVHDSLGEGYDRAGDTRSAITSYRKALEKEPPANQVERINGVLKGLESR